MEDIDNESSDEEEETQPILGIMNEREKRKRKI
jgi:hypothetical protein